jgi:hypothetical protein
MVAAAAAQDRHHRAGRATTHRETIVMRPSKVTDAMRAEVRAAVTARLAIPSNKQIAAKHGCCKAIVDRLSTQVASQLRAMNGVNTTSSNIVPDTEAAQ